MGAIITTAIFVFLAAGGCGFAAGEDPVGAAGAGQDASNTTPPDAGEPSLSQKESGEKIDIKISATGEDEKMIRDALDLLKQMNGEHATNGYDEKWRDTKLNVSKVMNKLHEQGCDEIGMDQCGPGETACVNPQNPSKVRITPEVRKLPPTMRSMVMGHECNHTGKGRPNYMHAMCPEGHEYAGKPACDTDAHGSYASMTTTFGNVAKFCTTCTGLVTGDARKIRDSQMKRLLGEAKEKVSSDVGQ
ncbi:MAG: hypothetical protein PHP45_06245 [Elusimicrobiales bacterium]|nr:hypothetical protein [Elusimicrobiales bacterium]